MVFLTSPTLVPLAGTSTTQFLLRDYEAAVSLGCKHPQRDPASQTMAAVAGSSRVNAEMWGLSEGLPAASG